MTSNRMTARKFLAREIQVHREAKELNRADFAQAVHVSESLVRAWEAARRIPQPDHLPAIEEVLGTSGFITRMRDDLVKTEPLPEYMGRWREVEDAASSLLWYQPLLIPGLLQTPEYAREVISNSGRVIEDIDEQIQARLERQKILAPENSLTFIAVLDEGVLHRLVGSAKVMHEQIMKLQEIAEQRNVRIQIVEADTGAYPGLAGGFGIGAMDGQEFAYVDDAFSGDVLEDPADVAVMKSIWLTLQSEARSSRQSAEIIAKAAEKWKQATE